MATPPTAMPASDATPAFRRVKNERRWGDDGDSLFICTSHSVRIWENQKHLSMRRQPRVQRPPPIPATDPLTKTMGRPNLKDSARLWRLLKKALQPLLLVAAQFRRSAITVTLQS